MTINIIMEKPNRMITENVKSDEIFTMRIDRYDGHQKTLSMKNAEYNQLWTPISIVASKISTLWISKISTFVIVVVWNIILVENSDAFEDSLEGSLFHKLE